MSALSSIHFLIIICFYSVSLIESRNLKLNFELDDSLVYLWPLPNEFTYGNSTVSIDPNLKLAVSGIGGNSVIVKEGFERYKSIIFKHRSKLRRSSKDVVYDVSELKIIVNSDNETLNYGVDESYSLFVDKKDGLSIVGEASIEANTVYGALRGLERQTYAKRRLKDESNSNSRVVTPSVVTIETNLVREEAIGVTAMVVHTSQVQSPPPRLLPSVLGTTPQLQGQRDVQPARVCEASQVQANRKVSSAPHMQRASTSNFQLISLGVVVCTQVETDGEQLQGGALSNRIDLEENNMVTPIQSHKPTDTLLDQLPYSRGRNKYEGLVAGNEELDDDLSENESELFGDASIVVPTIALPQSVETGRVAPAQEQVDKEAQKILMWVNSRPEGAREEDEREITPAMSNKRKRRRPRELVGGSSPMFDHQTLDLSR